MSNGTRIMNGRDESLSQEVEVVKEEGDSIANVASCDETLASASFYASRTQTENHPGLK
jgi:hypothetical protein